MVENDENKVLRTLNICQRGMFSEESVKENTTLNLRIALQSTQDPKSIDVNSQVNQNKIEISATDFTEICIQLKKQINNLNEIGF